jgi:hypothetical protein
MSDLSSEMSSPLSWHWRGDVLPAPGHQLFQPWGDFLSVERGHLRSSRIDRIVVRHSISFTWEFLEPVKNVDPSSPASLMLAEPKQEVSLLAFALQLSETLTLLKCVPI